VNTVTMLEFRRDAEKIIDRVRRGQRLMLTYRGKPVMRLEPVQELPVDGDDPFYALADLGVEISDSLDNDAIDRTVYGA
jgi:prevent-host-death family protein